MQSPYCFIVKPEGGLRYNNENEFGLILSNTHEDHTITNRKALVVETPIGYNGDVKRGDTLIVHHNVFRTYNDMKGRHRSGRSYLKDDLFLVDPDQFFMYSFNGGWKCPGKYCFVKPTGEHLTGEMKYINKELESLGVQSGDLVSFTPDSEYEFEIDGEKLYRMFTKNIAIRWEK